MDERTGRLTSLLTELAAQFVRREANPNPLITVTRTTLSPGKDTATLHFTCIPNAREQDALVFLKRNRSALREYIKAHSRLKQLPHLEWAIDYGERNRQRLDELSRDL